MNKKTRRYFSVIFLMIMVFIVAGRIVPAQSEFNLELKKTSIDRQNDTYVFNLAGETDLPEEAVLEGEISYAKKIPLHESLQKELGQEYQTEYYLMDKQMVNVKNSRFEITMDFLKRPLYSGDYNFKIKFDPNIQPETIRQQLPPGLKPIIRETTVAFGNPASLEQEKLTVQREVYRDLEEVQQLYQNLVRTVQRYQTTSPFDSVRWNQWYELWQSGVDKLLEKNNLRFEERIYWLESAGRYSVNMLGNELLRMAREFAKTQQDETFTKASKEFLAVFDYQLQSLGYQKIVDKPKTSQILAETKNYYQEQRANYQKYLADRSDLSLWSPDLLSRRSQIKKKLFALTRETPDYIFASYILPLGEDLTQYFSLIDWQLINNDQSTRLPIAELEKKIDGYFQGIAKTLELSR